MTVDTVGWAFVLQANAVSIQDRDGDLPLVSASRRVFPFTECAFADSAADLVAPETHVATRSSASTRNQSTSLSIPTIGVERFFAWINRNRRLAKDLEASTASAQVFLTAASVMLLLTRWRDHRQF
jgi:putative transposase